MQFHYTSVIPSHVSYAPCNYGMALPQVANGKKWTPAVGGSCECILGKYSLIYDKGWPSSLRVGRVFAQLAASREGLSSMELVDQYFSKSIKMESLLCLSVKC
jgi:hypothetical protein